MKIITSGFSNLFLILFAIFTTTAVIAYSTEQKKCVYTVYVKTGEVEKAGTNSKINLTLSDSSGKSISIGNLREWGLMGQRYDYFEKGNVDIFSGRSYCITPPICKLTLTSDGKGALPAWYVETVEVTFSGFNQQCSHAVFYVDRWLAPGPHSQLSIELDVCGSTSFPWPWPGSMGSEENGRLRSVVGNGESLSFASASGSEQ